MKPTQLATTISIRAVAVLNALTFGTARYLINIKKGLSLHPNRYCFYTLLYGVSSKNVTILIFKRPISTFLKFFSLC